MQRCPVTGLKNYTCEYTETFDWLLIGQQTIYIMSTIKISQNKVKNSIAVDRCKKPTNGAFFPDSSNIIFKISWESEPI